MANYACDCVRRGDNQVSGLLEYTLLLKSRYHDCGGAQHQIIGQLPLCKCHTAGHRPHHQMHSAGGGGQGGGHYGEVKKATINGFLLGVGF